MNLDYSSCNTFYAWVILMVDMIYRAWWSNNQPCCFISKTLRVLVSLIQRFITWISHISLPSPALSPLPLSCKPPPQIPHIPQAYLEEWVWGAWVKAELGALYSACQGCVHLETSLEKSGSGRFTFLTWPEFQYRSTPRHPKSPPEIKAGCIKKNLWVGFIRHADGPP